MSAKRFPKGLDGRMRAYSDESCHLFCFKVATPRVP